MSVPFEVFNPSGDLIRGDLHLPPHLDRRKVPVVVVCHGFKGFKDWGFFPFLAESISAGGLAAVRFNFSHSGMETDPDLFTRLDKFAVDTTGKQVEDLKSVLQALIDGALPQAECLDAESLGLFGHSRGAAAVLLVGAREPRVKVIVTWAGISTCEQWTEEVKETWRNEGRLLVTNARTKQEMPIDVSVLEDFERHKEEYDLLAAARSLKVPYLVVHGDEDETVPFSEGTLLHDNTPRGLRRLQIIPGAGHTFGATHPMRESNDTLDEAIRVTLEWLQARL